MNSITKHRVQELERIYGALYAISNSDEWPNMNEDQLFEAVMKMGRRKMNPIIVKREIARIQEFNMPSNLLNRNDRNGEEL